MPLTPHQAKYIAHDLTQRMTQQVQTEHLFTLQWEVR